MFSSRSQQWFSALWAYLRGPTDTTTCPSCWRHPLIGYAAGLLLVGGVFAIELLNSRMLSPISFPGVLFVFIIVVVAFLWGTLPSIFTVLLSLLVLDYLYIPPFDILGDNGWGSFLRLLTFAGASIIIVLLARQREAARRRAQRAEQNMEEFLRLICHELKTPLTIIRGNLELGERQLKRLASATLSDRDKEKLIEQLATSLERAKGQIVVQDRLVNDLLDATRIQAHTLKLLQASCNLIAIVQRVVEEQKRITPSRTIRLCLPTEQTVPINADADRVTQVLSNYVTNALKYSLPHRPVEVRLELEEAQARVSVRDEGPGIAPMEQERIWQRFYRVPGTEVQGGFHTGIGVGLFVCRTLVEQQGGQVGVQSHPGEGSTFWFTLPLLPQKAENSS
jgi:signal transduction histidine kinase